MTDTNKPQPFTSDAEYLDLAFAHLIAKARRIGLQRSDDSDVRPMLQERTVGRYELVAAEERRRQIDALEVEEQRLKERLDGRLTAHRADRDRPPLGIDVICENSGLNDEERTVLLACTAMAIGSEIGRQIAEGLGGNPFSRFETETAIKLMAPRNIGDWLQSRRLFDRSGALIKHDLIAVEYPSTTYAPTDVLSASVEVTAKAFSAITGTPREDDAEGPEDSHRPGAGR